jgi:OOP family OmpA-OmpF porin
MKTLAFAFAALSLATSSAFAQGYVGGAVGRAHFSADCAGTTSCTTNDTGFKIFGGYKFMPNMAAELTYFDYGKLTAGVPITGGTATLDVRGTGFGLGVAFMGDFTPEWSGIARLGVASNRAKVSVVAGALSGNDSERKTTAYAGLGVGYAFSKQLKAEAGIDFSNIEYQGERSNVRLISVGLTYSF